jgi:hypothetical protein
MARTPVDEGLRIGDEWRSNTLGEGLALVIEQIYRKDRKVLVRWKTGARGTVTFLHLKGNYYRWNMYV